MDLRVKGAINQDSDLGSQGPFFVGTDNSKGVSGAYCCIGHSATFFHVYFYVYRTGAHVLQSEFGDFSVACASSIGVIGTVVIATIVVTGIVVATTMVAGVVVATVVVATVVVATVVIATVVIATVVIATVVVATVVVATVVVVVVTVVIVIRTPAALWTIVRWCYLAE